MFRTKSRKIILAPLAGISSYPFRKICKESGADVVLSEMISADGLVRQSTKTIRLLYFEEDERPYGVQIFGSEPEIIAEAAYITSKFKPDFIDINLGCPVRKVVKRGAGSALLKNISKIDEIIKSVIKCVDIPVTAKIRSGWDDNNIVCIEVAKLLEDNSVSAITVHPRTQKMMFKGKADWELIRQVKENVNIPVIGNGDIFCGADAKRMFDETHCDHIMLGRGTLGNPWIFNKIKKFLKTGKEMADPPNEKKIDICIKQLELAIKAKGNHYGLLDMRKHIGWYLKSMPNSSPIKKEIFSQNDEKIVKNTLLNYKKNLSNTS